MQQFNKFLNIFAYVFNIIYFLVCLPLVPFLSEYKDAVFNLIFPTAVVFLLPLIFFLFVCFKKNRIKTVDFFFGIEVPVLLLSLTRIIFMRELTPFYFLILISIVLAILFFFFDFINIKNEKLQKIKVYIFEVPIVLSTYFSILALFFIIPLIIYGIKSIFSIDYIDFIKSCFECLLEIDFLQIIAAIYSYLIAICSILIFLLFILSPITSTIVYVKQFIIEYKKTKNKKSCLVFALVYVLILGLSSFHLSSLNLDSELSAVKNAKTYEELQQIKISPIKQYFIKRIYLDNYVANQRYVFDKNSDIISSLYGDKETFNNKTLGLIAQNVFNKIAYPFYYPESFSDNSANDKFIEFFNDDMQLQLRKDIKNSINSTYFNKSETATLLDIDSKDVLVKKRDIIIEKTKTQSIYKVVFVETYQNQKKDDREVYYEFSLPKNAVITALSLGTNLQYKGVLSSKGAARKTYLAQTIKRKDPALLEKNGPIQYTLRVYPVYGKRAKLNQKVSFEYYVYSKEGIIPLPNFSQSRNAFFGFLTKENITYENKIVKAKNNQVIVDDSKKNGFNLPQNQRVALLFDTSYSNKINWEEYSKKELSSLIELNSVDFYFFNKFLSPKMHSLESIKQKNFSKSARYDAYCSLDNDYDSAIIFSTNSVFDYSKFDYCKNNFPLYIIHLSDKNTIPPYNKALTNLIYETKGAIGTSLEEVFYDDKLQFDSSNKQVQVFKSRAQIDNLLPYNPQEIFDIAKKYNIVTDYSSLIALVDERQKKELEFNEQQTDKFQADLIIGKEEGIAETKDIESVPEPNDYLLIITMLLISLIFYKKKERC